MTADLKVSHLRKSFNGRTVLDDVSLNVKPGLITGLLGPNGSGKTTAFKIIAGLLPPDNGTVEYNTVLDRLPLNRRAALGLGYLSQEPSVFGGLTVFDNLMGILSMQKKKNCRDKTEELLDRFNLDRVAGQKAHTLSGGERRKLEFARALCSTPGILLVDEPFAGVDPIAASEISKVIAQLAGDGIGILLTDHQVREALSICDNVYLIVDGKIVVQGTSDQIKSSELAKQLYLGSSFQ
jgi:lipopolysaccharide export system ATP-binding protein